ncbi:hypothetical protein [Polaribacter atrinae]|uniref:PLAT domain-containing protein n=1 Tax=Polaribacter atrinae TaxID=1333662 RepID=A0A176TG11_9FLAO|nr:hypothetical protein [Polaribacter atrinae]OAD46335.1 hypothetical protein LPB303_02020 [Polaribacter atrinae]
MKLKIIFLVSLLAFLGCSETTETTLELCNECVIIDNNLYNKTATTGYNISNAVLNGDLLTVNIAASGCDGNSWSATLVDANLILESNPTQRNIKINFVNKEACLAVWSKDFTFNISHLKESNTTILLNLYGWDSQIQY